MLLLNRVNRVLGVYELSTGGVADLQLTKKIKQGGELLDIAVLDHIILTSEGYHSLADEGLL